MGRREGYRFVMAAYANVINRLEAEKRKCTFKEKERKIRREKKPQRRIFVWRRKQLEQ